MRCLAVVIDQTRTGPYAVEFCERLEKVPAFPFLEADGTIVRIEAPLWINVLH